MPRPPRPESKNPLAGRGFGNALRRSPSHVPETSVTTITARRFLVLPSAVALSYAGSADPLETVEIRPGSMPWRVTRYSLAAWARFMPSSSLALSVPVLSVKPVTTAVAFRSFFMRRATPSRTALAMLVRRALLPSKKISSVVVFGPGRGGGGGAWAVTAGAGAGAGCSTTGSAAAGITTGGGGGGGQAA